MATCMESETRNQKQETRNKKQETRNKKQETRNKKQETRNLVTLSGAEVPYLPPPKYNPGRCFFVFYVPDCIFYGSQ